MTLHRYMLNRRLASVTPLRGTSIEIGNGRRRRGLDTGAWFTFDLNEWRQPSVVGDAHRLPIKDASVDGVICCETLQYVEQPEAVLREARRVTRRGGALVLSLPFQRYPHKLDTADRLYRWTEICAVDLVTCAGFAVSSIVPLWPPWYRYTSGWFIEARAA